MLLTNTQILKIRKACANGSSANINFSKTQRSKMIQLRGYLPILLNLVQATNKGINII